MRGTRRQGRRRATPGRFRVVTEPEGAAADTHSGVDWEARYAGTEQVWSGNPNTALVAEVSGMTPGTAVDVGCGEGADAIWLAQQGWDVTAFDVASNAVARATRHSEQAGVRVRLLQGALLDPVLPAAQFDLVNAQYPALLHEQGRSVAALLGLVRPGGTLLVVHHAEAELAAARRPGLDPADYVLPRDVHAALGADWEVQVYEERPRHVTTGAGAAHRLDRVLKARRATA